MLEIKDLATAYGKIEALKGVSLSARAGEVTCMLGPNGAGKTTLMMTLAGILRPRRGSITFEGEELVGKSPAEIVARGLALVPENRLVFPALTVKENLMAGAFRRRDRTAIRSDIERMFDRFPRLRERVGQLAGTVGAEHAGHLAGPGHQRHALQGLDLAVGGGQVLDLEHRCSPVQAACAAGSSSVPR